jgi:excisionase family DNA binding protein
MPTARDDQEPTMSADQEGRGVTITEAARRLGVSENAIRQRIKRGTVAAWKVDGVWRVMLAEGSNSPDQQTDHQDDQEADRQGRPSGDYEPVMTSAVSLAARAQLSAIVEEMLAPLVAQHEARTADLARQIGRLEAERDALWSRLEQMEAEQDVAEITNKGPGATETPDSAEAAGASLWSRFRRWYRGEMRERDG